MAARHPPDRFRRSWFYVILPLLMIAMAVIGFWPQYYGRLASGSPLEGVSLHPLVHLHSSLFLAWLGIILLQALLVHSGRAPAHRRLGPWLAAIGYLAAAVGVIGGLVLAGARVRRGGPLDEAAIFVAAPLLDMIMFATFLTAALVYRRRPQIHKRLILFTGYSFAFIGLVRYLIRIPGMMDSAWMPTFLLMAPILFCIAWEAITRRRVHPVWWIGLGLFFIRLMLEFAAGWPWWLPIGRALVGPFTS